MAPSVVLCNPPGSRCWLRDGYCSLEGRWATRFHPMDLLVQSALLRDRARVTVVEAIGSRLSPDEALARVVAAEPDLVLSLVGSASQDEDAAFLARVRDRLPRATIALSGDLVRFEDDALARFPMADGGLMDFTAPDLLSAIDGAGEHWWARGSSRPPRRRHGGRFRYGLPDYAAFPEAHYRLPYRPGRIGSPLSSFGCPFPCRFCNTSQVSWKVREPDDFLAEVRWLADQGVRHAYVRDATFGVDRDHRAEVLAGLRRLPRPVTWNSFTRIDLFEDADFAALYDSGCRVLQLGLEGPDEDALRRLHKPLRQDRVRHGIAQARAAGIAVCGHFLVGLPGDADPDASARATVAYAVALGCDYASFNVAAPRPGAPFRHQQGFLPLDRARALQGDTMRAFYTDRRTVFRQLRRSAHPAFALHAARQAVALLRG